MTIKVLYNFAKRVEVLALCTIVRSTTVDAYLRPAESADRSGGSVENIVNVSLSAEESLVRPKDFVMKKDRCKDVEDPPMSSKSLLGRGFGSGLVYC